LLAPLVEDWSPDKFFRVGGLDIGFEVGTNRATAVLIVCEVQEAGLKLVYEDAIDLDMDLPYVSGFLFVRELPAYQTLLQRLRRWSPQLEPEVFLVDGSGMFHPREFGSASHFGVVENVRTIGVAKKLLVFDDFGQEEGRKVEETELPNLGDEVKIIGTQSKRIYGIALRTSACSRKKEASTRRVYVSVGHRVSLETSKQIILKCCDVAGGSYIPEPIRMADLTGRAIERAWKHLQTSSPAGTRRLIMDVCNLLDDRQRKTLLGVLEERAASEMMATIPPEELKRKQATIDELFRPFCEMHPQSRVEEVCQALKMEKPWAASLAKAKLACHTSGEAMTSGQAS